MRLIVRLRLSIRTGLLTVLENIDYDGDITHLVTEGAKKMLHCL